MAPLLVKKLNETVDIGLTLHVEEAALRVFKGVGWRHLGVIPQYVRVLNARAFVRTFARRGGQFLTGRRRGCGGLARVSGPVAVLVGVTFAGRRRRGAAAPSCCRRHRGGGAGVRRSYTELAERVKDKVGVWVFRDAPVPGGPVRTTDGAPTGCWRAARTAGSSVTRSSSSSSSRTIRAWATSAWARWSIASSIPTSRPCWTRCCRPRSRCCRRERVDVVFCAASLRALGRRLRRHGFIAMPGTLNAAFHDRTGALADNPPLESWHLMRGDSDADANC